MSLSVNDILIRMIKSIDIFNWISDQECIDLAKDFVLQYHPRWTLIIKEWTKPAKLYILKNWKLEAKKANWLSSIKLWEILPWQIFGEMSYLKDANAMASISVMEDSDVWELPSSDFGVFLKKYPYIMDKVMETINQREQQNIDKLANLNNDQSDDLDDLRIII